MAVRRIDITGDFNHTIDNPMVEHSWDIYKDEMTDTLRVRGHSRAPGLRNYEFKFNEGSLFLVNTYDKKYVYFRHKEFQDLLDLFAITKIDKKDPNEAVCELTCGTDHERNKSFKIFTDGEFYIKDTVSNEDDSSTTYTVGFNNANWVILETDGGKGKIYRTFVADVSPHNVLLTVPKPELLEPVWSSS